MRGLLAQRSRIRRRRNVSRRGIKRWGVGVESTWIAEAQGCRSDKLKWTLVNTRLEGDLFQGFKVIMVTTAITTALTWWRRVGVGVARWRSGRVHPISRGRRESVGPVGHVGASTKPRRHWLTSWRYKMGGEGERWGQMEAKTIIFWHF